MNLNLRHVFVSMLFALVISELAVATYETLESYQWTTSWWSQNKESLLHLLVALSMITTSWVGWSNTFYDGDYPKQFGILSKGYVLLLIDILIVTAYFGLVKTVDSGSDVSGVAEANIVLLIFLLYLIWDIVYARGRSCHIEIIPSSICLFVALLIATGIADKHVVATDIALIFLIFSFRTIKYFQTEYLVKKP